MFFFYLQKLIPHTQQLLKEGALTDENVLDHVSKITNVVRECNVTLRWLMLHASIPGVCEYKNKIKSLAKIYMPTTILILNINFREMWKSGTSQISKVSIDSWRTNCDRPYEPWNIFGFSPLSIRIYNNELLHIFKI